MAMDLDKLEKNYYSLRTDIFPDGSTRIWKTELRPASTHNYRNLVEGYTDLFPDYVKFHDLFIDKIECMESELERQIGLQTPPEIKISLSAEYIDEEFRTIIEQSEDYEDQFTWSPVILPGELPLDYPAWYKPIHNTWMISYSDDGGENWKWWFVGVQLPNEVSEYRQSVRTKEIIPVIEITCQHITHWLLTQVEYSLWGDRIISAGDTSHHFDFRLANIVYDTIFQQDFTVRGSYSTRTETRIVNYSENWGVGGDRPNKDEAWFVKYNDCFRVLRSILNHGLRAHRIHSEDEDIYGFAPMNEVSAGASVKFYAQNYETNGELGDLIIHDDIWLLVGSKPQDATSFYFGLFIDNLKSNGQGFDGKTTADSITNILKSFGSKGVYRVDTYYDVDPQMQLIGAPLLAAIPDTKTLDAVEDFGIDWKFERGEYIARGAAFNVSVEGDNDSEFRVYGSGNQDRDDVESKMQLHNMPNIRDYGPWDNSDCPPDLGVPEMSYRVAGFTLRRFWYLDQPPGMRAAPPDWADGKMPIRVHEYVEFYDGVKLWDNSNGNTFTAVPRHQESIKADMLIMQRSLGMPNIIARVLSNIFTRKAIGKFTGTTSIKKVDYNDVGAEFSITIPTSFKRLQNGKFFLESVKPNFEKLESECVFIFIPDEVV